MESQPQNPEFRSNHEIMHLQSEKISGLFLNSIVKISGLFLNSIVKTVRHGHVT